MTSTFKCNTCDEEFNSKMERKYHIRDTCKRWVSLTDNKAMIHQVERIDGKFLCPQCPETFTRADNMNRHWKTCKVNDEGEGMLLSINRN